MLGDTVNALSADDVRGKIVVVTPAAGGGRGGFGGGRGGGAPNPLQGAAAIAVVSSNAITAPRLQYVLNDTVQNDGRAAYAAANPAPPAAGGRGGRGGGGGGTAPLQITVSPALAAAMLGMVAAR